MGAELSRLRPPSVSGLCPRRCSSPHGLATEFRTKVDGVPYWTANGPTAIPELPRTPFRYLLQIDTFLVLPGPVPEPATIGCDVHRFRDTRLVES